MMELIRERGVASSAEMLQFYIFRLMRGFPVADLPLVHNISIDSHLPCQYEFSNTGGLKRKVYAV